MTRKRNFWNKIEDDKLSPQESAEKGLGEHEREVAEDMRERFATGCYNNYDEPTDPLLWDDVSSHLADSSTGAAFADDQALNTSESPSQFAAAPPTTSAAAASTSSAAAPASKRSTSRIQRQNAVCIELGARLDAIKEHRQQRKKNV
ncbi:hypothetical protein MRX96_042774 [Rhipicephalus microplus]